MQLELKCQNQSLEWVIEPDEVCAGNVNVDSVKFEFCELWNGFTKTAVFHRENAELTIHVLLDETNTCTIPPEITETEGLVYIGVFGDKTIDNEYIRRTTEPKAWYLKEGIAVSGKPSDPTPDIYAQLLQKLKTALDEKLDKKNFETSDYGSFNLTADNKYTKETYKCDLYPHVKRVGSANDVGRLVVPAEYVINDDYTMKQGDKIVLVDTDGISHIGYIDSIEQRVDDPTLYNINANYDGLDFNNFYLADFQKNIVKADFYSCSNLELEYKLKKTPEKVSEFLNDVGYLSSDTIYNVIEKVPKGTTYEGVLTYTPKGDDTEISIPTSDILRGMYEIDPSTSIPTLRLVFDAKYGEIPYQIHRAFENYGKLPSLFTSNTQSHPFYLYRATLRADGLYDFNFGTDDEETLKLIQSFTDAVAATKKQWIAITVDTTNNKSGYYEWKKIEDINKAQKIDNSILLYNPLRFNANPKTDIINIGASAYCGLTTNIIVNVSNVPNVLNTSVGDIFELTTEDSKVSFEVCRVENRYNGTYCITVIDHSEIIRQLNLYQFQEIYSNIRVYKEGYEWVDKSEFITSSNEYQALKQAIIDLGGTI